MSWPFYLALKQLFPGGRKVPPFFTLISILGVALGVTILIISMSVMGGFGYEIRKMVVDTQGEVQVRARGFILNPSETLARIQQTPGVKAATPFAEGVVMLQSEGRPAFPAMQGIDLARVEAVTPLQKFMRAGSLENLDDDSVILSSQLARSLGAHIGTQIEVYSPLMLEKFKKDEVFMPRQLRVAGIFEIGHQQLDSSLVLVTLRLMQDLYGMDAAVHGINVKITPDASPSQVARNINQQLPFDQRAAPWMESNQDFLFVLQMEKSMIFFLLLFIVLVASFSIACSLLTAVVRKTREIGLLGALGARPSQVALCFCLQGLVIGAAGTVAGNIIGFTALHYRDNIVGFLTRVTGGEQALLNAYQFNRLPAHLLLSDYLMIVSGTILISLLAGLLPAWRAARLKPVEALRSE
ncbi:ABC transporter permease [Opitutaceae bacterium TAV4]|nr:ABC transporter permease [Opitutaceae bacterium TAV4]RRK02174.1 ABC transporter permease [Opitutaceae bacterium TAV3]